MGFFMQRQTEILLFFTLKAFVLGLENLNKKSFLFFRNI